MRLVVTTPTAVIEDVADLRHIRAEDETGAFGILPGHADFVTILPVSVITWQGTDGCEGFVLVQGGFLSVRNGDLVEVAARNAFRQDELSALGETALEELLRSRSVEEETRTADSRLHLATMRQIETVLRVGRYGKSAAPKIDAVRGTAGGADARPGE